MSAAGSVQRRMSAKPLILQVPGEGPVNLDQGAEMTFGRGDGPLQLRRSGEIDPMMSRTVGQVWFDGVWLLHNPDGDEPGRPPLHVIATTGARVIVEPGCSTALRGRGTIRFKTTPETSYDLYFRVDGDEVTVPPARVDDSFAGTEKPHLTPREVDYLVTFAMPELFAGTGESRPSTEWVAERWGVSGSAVEKAVKEARDRLQRLNYLDLGGRTGPRDLTERFVRNLTSMRLLTRADWEWAFPADGSGPRRAEDGPRFSKRKERPDDGGP